MKSIGLFLVILFLSACTTTKPQTAINQQLNLAGQPDDTMTDSLTPSGPITLEASQPTTTQTVTLQTSKGDISLELFTQEAPQTVQNFLTKASSGFYQNLTFHRVEDWVIQGGDPQGNGTGGGQMTTELNQIPFQIGSLGVARGENIAISNDSQFFICTSDCSWLSGQYTNFGRVTSGLEIAKSIVIGDTITAVTVD